MSMTGLPILGMLKTAMQWHEARQRVLAENVANADTPGFMPRDLAPMSGDRAGPRPTLVAVAVTNPSHLSGHNSESDRTFDTRDARGWETTPDGNAVVLEEQMMKLTQNQMDHQTVSALYGRSLALLRTAIGSR